MPNTLLWHDYETFGTDPARDRIAQFAALRTDEDLNPIEEPLVLYCQPASDTLPHPEACLVTGITPQKALQAGVPEAVFAARIHDTFARPGTCGAGYNSLRFDDEFTRHLLYRNFYDPYEREWRNGNSRWDLIDVVRLTRALRPDGIDWPDRDDGHPSYRLEDLTAANGIDHADAHDALADVHATIALARLLRDRKPRLYHHVYQRRQRGALANLLDPARPAPVIHVSGKYPAERFCLAVVMPLARHPVNRNGVIVYDLSVDPHALLTLSADAIRERVFTAADDLPDGTERLPLKVVHLNRCPMVVPEATLRPQDAERLGLDVALCRRHFEALRQGAGVAHRVREAFQPPAETGAPRDPEEALYGGGFLNDRDRTRLAEVRDCPPEALGQRHFAFEDPRLPNLLFRYRARNHPDTLTPDEFARWQTFRRDRLSQPAEGRLTLAEYRERIAALRGNAAHGSASHQAVLAELDAYANWLERWPGSAESN